MRHPSKSEMERARLNRDASYDGVFWVGVRTMRVFCRPSCPAKQPLERNVVYLGSIEDAARAGFRPCKRCRPTETTGQQPEWVQRLLAFAGGRQGDRITDTDIRTLDIDPARARRWFRRNYGVTFHAYLRAARLGEALAALKNGADILQAGLEQGYESASGFHEAFVRKFGATPSKSGGVRRVVVRSIESPVGRLDLAASERGVCLVEFADRRALPTEIAEIERWSRRPVVPGSNEHIDHVAEELQAYFHGKLTEFTARLDVFGTAFQQAVWSELRRIPYGKTISYGELAAKIGRPGAQRAVGRANGQNRLAIVIPCHRVVESGGKLRGYGGGLWRKQYLLDLEAGRRSTETTLAEATTPASTTQERRAAS